jgi:hypothetical protein
VEGNDRGCRWNISFWNAWFRWIEEVEVYKYNIYKFE